MSFQQKFLIVVLLSTVVALGLVFRLPSVRSEHGNPPAVRGRGVWASLAAMAIALLLVGMVSHTLLRHVIQITPLAAALAVAARRPALGVPAAVPLFTFWLFVMGGIWLFLLGIAPVFTGRFSPVEIILTIVIGLASVGGLVAAFRLGTVLSVGARLVLRTKSWRVRPTL